MGFLLGICAGRAVMATGPTEALARLISAHERRPAFAVESRSPAVDLRPEITDLFKSRPGWWNAPAEYIDPISGRGYPIVNSSRYACDEQSAVAVVRRRHAGPPADQLHPLRQLVSPTLWVEQHDLSSESATFIRYAPRTAADDRSARRAGRVPHSDVLGALIYPRLVDSVIARLAAARDLVVVTDADTSILASEAYGVSAWIAPDGALEAAQILTHTGEKRRYVFSGVAATPFFPARFPAEMRVYRDQAAPGSDANGELLEIELFAAPEALSADDRANLDPARLGLRLVERSGGVLASSTGSLPAAATPWWKPRTSGVLLAVLVGVFAFVVACWLLRRRGHGRRSASAG